jgi:hypothetical protein
LSSWRPGLTGERSAREERRGAAPQARPPLPSSASPSPSPRSAGA